MPRWLSIFSLFTALGTGLIAGTFFAFSVFVMPALIRLPAAQGIAAMRSINLVILDSLFMPVFLGAALACLGLGTVALFQLHHPHGPWLLAGSLLYLLGGLGVTVAFNVPLNDALAAVQPGSPATEIWRRYFGPWTAWNALRTLASLCSTAVLIMTLLRS